MRQSTPSHSRRRAKSGRRSLGTVNTYCRCAARARTLYRQSIQVIKELMGGRMYPTTLEGLERAMKLLAK